MKSNEDHCSSCRSLGDLIYCDGCPRAFHLWCLDPPLETSELPDGETWYCPACILQQVRHLSPCDIMCSAMTFSLQKPPHKPPTSLKFMAPLVAELQSRIPVEFQLPLDIRSYFKDGEGCVYVNTRSADVDCMHSRDRTPRHVCRCFRDQTSPI